MSQHKPTVVESSAGRAIAIERRAASELPYTAFLHEYVRNNRPVVIEGAAHDCPALHKWTPEYFKSQFGTRKVHVGYQQHMQFAEFIDAILASREDAPGPYMYRMFIGPYMPELLPDLVPLNDYAFTRRLASPLMPKSWRRPDGYLKLLIGGVGGRFPFLHFDGENAHATITELYGKKAFILYPPSDSQFLYPAPDLPNRSPIPDIDNVDLDCFPLFANATRHHTVLRPGDMIFVPSRWWHAARVLTPSISICQNMLDRSNWSGYVKEVCPRERGLRFVKNTLKQTYLTGLGHALTLLEQMPRRGFLGGKAGSRMARLGPAVAAEARPVADWPVQTWRVRVR